MSGKRSICRAVVKCIQNFGRKYLKGRRQLESAQKKPAKKRMLEKQCGAVH